MRTDDDLFCLDCNESLDVSASFSNKRYCDSCIKKRKQTRDNKRYYNRKISDTYHTIKVILLQSPYFSGDNLIKPDRNKQKMLVQLRW